MYLFFIIEFKSDSLEGSGSLWAATNQCLRSFASGVNIAERLNRQRMQCKNTEARLINSAVFSIAMTGTQARLFVSWKHNELDYYTQRVKGFILQDPQQYVEFRKHVRNIINWGKGKCLEEIRDSLHNLLEESRRRASELAKSRPPPLDDSTSSNSHKRKGRRTLPAKGNADSRSGKL